jgi:hypothetical protein
MGELDLYLEGDDGLLQGAEMDGAPSRPTKGYMICPLAWLARVRPQLRSADQLLVALVLYRRCLMQRSRTVGLPNGELQRLGVRRQTKYRSLAQLEEAGVLTIETRNGRSTRVTLHWFP